MATDIVLDDRNGNWLTLQGAVINGVAADFILDHPARRNGNTAGIRRALVHDSQDGLTLNYNGDYKGGITLNYVASISPKPRRRTRYDIRHVDELNVEGGIRFVWDNGLVLGGPVTEEVSLQKVIEDLRNQVEALEARVTTLESA